MSGSAPPGWYPDGTGGQRYWDGGRWLDAPPPGPPPSGPPPSGPPPSAPPSYGAPSSGRPPYGAPSGGGAPSGPRSWADAAYAAPPGPPPGPPRRSRTPLWVALGVAAVVVVVALVTTLVLPTGGDGSGDQADPGPTSQTDSGESDEPTEDPQPTEEPQGDPADTVQAFIDAALDGDCQALEDLVTDDFLDESGDCSDDEFDGSTLEGIELEVGDTEIDGDSATVGLISRYQGQSEEIDLRLVYEDDAWLIDGSDALDPPSASDAPVQPSPS